jgi:hypothetical protein
MGARTTRGDRCAVTAEQSQGRSDGTCLAGSIARGRSCHRDPSGRCLSGRGSRRDDTDVAAAGLRRPDESDGRRLPIAARATAQFRGRVPGRFAHAHRRFDDRYLCAGIALALGLLVAFTGRRGGSPD